MWDTIKSPGETDQFVRCTHLLWLSGYMFVSLLGFILFTCWSHCFRFVFINWLMLYIYHIVLVWFCSFVYPLVKYHLRPFKKFIIFYLLIHTYPDEIVHHPSRIMFWGQTSSRRPCSMINWVKITFSRIQLNRESNFHISSKEAFYSLISNQ